jgi:hypothetical protein
MPSFPPQIVTALLSGTSSHEPNDEARTLRKRSERSRVGSRRRYRLTDRETGWVTVSTNRLADDPAAASRT